jgi:RHS repeat-associated protein
MIIPAGQANAGTYLVTWNGHGDALALWRIKADGSLEVANTFAYSTWGVPTTTSNFPNSANANQPYGDLGFRFQYVGASGVQWDNFLGLGLHYMHARHYSPSLGRFLQPDPSRVESNSYTYASNDPVSCSDPTGLFDCKTLKGQIIKVALEVFRRGNELVRDVHFLPWWTRHQAFPWGTVKGHMDKFLEQQRRLRNMLDDWDDQDCGGPGNGGKLPYDVWAFAYQAVPKPAHRRVPPPGFNWSAPTINPTPVIVAVGVVALALARGGGLSVAGAKLR